MAHSAKNIRTTRKTKHSVFRGFGAESIKHLLLGMVRGIGTAIGVSGIAVVLLLITRFIPLEKIPILGDIVRAIVAGSGN